MITTVQILTAILSCFVTHEAGHYFAARVFGERLEFRFAWGWLFGKIPVPRYIWYMPDINVWKKQTIALSGFGAEIIFALFVLAFYSPAMLIFTALHLSLYKFYAGSTSDFKWF